MKQPVPTRAGYLRGEYLGIVRAGDLVASGPGGGTSVPRPDGVSSTAQQHVDQREREPDLPKRQRGAEVDGTECPRQRGGGHERSEHRCQIARHQPRVLPAYAISPRILPARAIRPVSCLPAPPRAPPRRAWGPARPATAPPRAVRRARAG